MRRRITSSVLVAAILGTLAAAPTGAQLGGMSGFEPELLDPGAEPRQELRYRYTEGPVGILGMDMVMDMVSSMDGVALADLTTALTAHLDTTVSEVYDDGSARLDQTFVLYDMAETGDPAIDAELDAMSELFEGLSIWSVVDDQGRLVDYGLESAVGLPPELEAQLLQNTSGPQPLPEEAVGVGARWTSTDTTVSQGVPMEMTVETELVSMSDEALVLDLQMSGGSDDMATALMGEMPASIALSVDRFDFGGGGEMVVDLDGLIPTSTAVVDMVMDISLEGEEAGQTVQMSIGFDMTMGVDVYPVE